MLMLLYKKTFCQFQIKFITDDYLQMCKTLQLFTNSFTFNSIYFTSIKVIKNTYVKNVNFIKAWVKLKLGPIVLNFLQPKFINFRNKLE